MRLVLCALLAAGCHRPSPVAPPVTNTVGAPTPAVRTSPYPPVDIPFMARGYFFASSELDHGLGGNGTFDNAPRPNTLLADVPGARSGLYVAVLPDSVAPFEQKFDGVRVVVVNDSLMPVPFQAQDSRLEILHEAKDEHGDWKPIEFLPSSWCGNSYHTLTLPAGRHWEFTAPHYTGTYATKLRVKVVAGDHQHEQVLYSNEFAGRINPTQFTERQAVGSTNVMDPYGGP
ncbi:MAG TPA: hypothetical protein VM513_04705 [Kofleriaceae bacterium]|jgi:hypothetical protein|nr:hypothetical protein [Kofleriaceae bacterium]